MYLIWQRFRDSKALNTPRNEMRLQYIRSIYKKFHLTVSKNDKRKKGKEILNYALFVH